MNIAIQPKKSDRIRAVRLANPSLGELEIGQRLGFTLHEVRSALKLNPKRRVKSVAP